MRGEAGTVDRRGRVGGGARSGIGRSGALALAGLAALIGVACGQREQSAQAPAAGEAPAAAPGASAPPASATEPPRAGGAAGGDAAKGKQIYAINCTACHNADPTRDGVLGPAIAGSSLALVEARVVHGSYPPGYTPKRPTKQMVPLPHLAASVPDLAAYLERQN